MHAPGRARALDARHRRDAPRRVYHESTRHTPLSHTRGEPHEETTHLRGGALRRARPERRCVRCNDGERREPKVTPPSSIASAKQLLFCSDITYPPEEFYNGTTPVGSDIEIGDAIAAQMGVKASFQNTGFDGIIPALLSKKCDAVISGMNDTRRAASRSTSPTT